MDYDGIGPKTADCICLMALDKLEAFWWIVNQMRGGRLFLIPAEGNGRDDRGMGAGPVRILRRLCEAAALSRPATNLTGTVPAQVITRSGCHASHRFPSDVPMRCCGCGCSDDATQCDRAGFSHGMIYVMTLV